jgi:hypothetical protein
LKLGTNRDIYSLSNKTLHKPKKLKVLGEGMNGPAAECNVTHDWADVYSVLQGVI